MTRGLHIPAPSSSHFYQRNDGVRVKTNATSGLHAALRGTALLLLVLGTGSSWTALL